MSHKIYASIGYLCICFFALRAAAQTVTTNGGSTNSIQKFFSAPAIINSAIPKNKSAMTVAFAQQPSPSIDVQAILEHSRLVMGCDMINPTTTITVHGLLTVGSTVMPVTIQSQGNQRWRSELQTAKERKVTVVNDGIGQIQHENGQVTTLANHNTFHQRPMHIPCLTNMALHVNQVDANYLRAETAGADTLDIIELFPKSRPSMKAASDLMRTLFWVSQSSGYLVKVQYVNAAEGSSNDMETVEIDYSDYRNVNGLAVPFHQVTRAEKVLLDLQFNSVQLNTAAADFNLR